MMLIITQNPKAGYTTEIRWISQTDIRSAFGRAQGVSFDKDHSYLAPTHRKNDAIMPCYNPDIKGTGRFLETLSVGSVPGASNDITRFTLF